MHFSIPDTQELNEGNGSTFIGYNIHINGVFHCTVRYKQLHYLHEQLKREFGYDDVPTFPPKKLLPLTSGQLEERRVLLEKYIQSVGQDQKMVSSDLVCGFLLSAQQETACDERHEIHLEVYTMNNYPIKIRITSCDCTEKLLVRALKSINLPVEFMQYFSLYLIKVDNSSETLVLRKLLPFEAPYLTQRVMRCSTRIVIRKNYWDMIFDNELMKDPVALNLLYIQIVTDLEKGWILAMRESKSQLEKLKNKLAKREYIEFAQKLKFYGFMQFAQCYCDYPELGTRVLVAIGDEELSLRIMGPGNMVKEGVFKVTRMRCWRITATNNKRPANLENGSYSNNTHQISSLELSFEYLMSKDKLQWVTISSDQAILMSVCLQSLVDELLMKKNGRKNLETEKRKNRETDKMHKKLTYMKRDGSCQLISTQNIFSDDQEINGESYQEEEPFSIKTLQEKFSTVSFKSGRAYIENHAFEGIGDEDL